MGSRPDMPLVVTVPGWVDDVVTDFSGPLQTDDDRMALAITLSKHNIERGGGPFGAVVFLGPRLVGAGVNRVIATGFSIAHAEIVALMRAQRALAESTPGSTPASQPDPAGGAVRYTLVTTAEPCCQCFGAVVWSGIDHLVCGATTDDAEAIGFDEGPKPDAWAATLESRGIQVTRQVRREEARAVLNDYVRHGGTIYGARRSPAP